MIDQIYHTSHCGSTLLISLLKENIKAYSEPRWTHQVIAGKEIIFACNKSIVLTSNDDKIELTD